VCVFVCVCVCVCTYPHVLTHPYTNPHAPPPDSHTHIQITSCARLLASHMSSSLKTFRNVPTLWGPAPAIGTNLRSSAFRRIHLGSVWESEVESGVGSESVTQKDECTCRCLGSTPPYSLTGWLVHTETWRHRDTVRQIDRRSETFNPRDHQTDRQTDRQTVRQTDR